MLRLRVTFMGQSAGDLKHQTLRVIPLVRQELPLQTKTDGRDVEQHQRFFWLKMKSETLPGPD